MNAATQRHYLAAMGIPIWRPKREIVAASEAMQVTEVVNAASVHRPMPAALLAEINSVIQANPTPSLITAVPSPVQAPAHHPITTVAEVLPDLSWEALQAAVAQCERCSLAKTRTKTVFGAGNPQADWLIVGEAPGADEDRQGEPFVGRAGQLLTRMLSAIGLQRSQVYILNMLKCRPPNNRDPLPDEVANCRGYLERQIELIQPRLILVVGRIAAQHLLQTRLPLAQLRGQTHYLPQQGIPVVVTYHPAYLLRKPLDKRKAWQDLRWARQLSTQ